ncbi:MAG TPA: ribonuclease HI family protein [Bacteroidota bacterium]|nr:ribonuclease HI family protein [Bacteroidota bacterium]
MILHAFTDGASRGNPGEAGIGIVVTDGKSETVLSLHGYIGVCTNNVAEYTAMETLLERAGSLACSRMIIHADSELMVRQINGQYRVRDRGLKPHHAKTVRLMRALPFPCTVTHIPREENREADRLANMGIDEKIPVQV